MQRNNYQWILVDSLSSSAADLLTRNRCLYYKGQRLFKYDDIEPNSIVKSAAVAVTQGVITFTPVATPVVGTTYTIQFLQPILNAQGTLTGTVPKYYTVVSTGATPTLLCDQFRTLLAAEGTTYVAGSGTTTLVVTAATAYPVISSGAWTVNGGTVAQTTQGVYATNTEAYLTALGAPSTFSASAYTIYYLPQFAYVGESNTMRVNQGATIALGIQTGVAFSGIFITAMDTALDVSSYTKESVNVGGQ